jgi:hypothetical protein
MRVENFDRFTEDHIARLIESSALLKSNCANVATTSHDEAEPGGRQRQRRRMYLVPPGAFRSDFAIARDHCHF